MGPASVSPFVVWKDATGAKLNVVAVGTRMLHIEDPATHAIWIANRTSMSAELSVDANEGIPLRFESDDCTGTPYVLHIFFARTTTRLAHKMDAYLMYPDTVAAKERMLHSKIGYDGACALDKNNTLPVIPLSAMVPVQKPTSLFVPPVHAEVL
jgi:hypothetical protein